MSANQRPLRVGIVGAGYVSRFHIRALQTLQEAQIIGIADLDADRARVMARRFGIPKTFRTLEEMAPERPHVVHVLTPPASHCSITLQALEMGCHVLVEKPMAVSLDECDRMIAMAAKHGRILSVNHSAKFDPMVRQALAWIEGGRLGEILAVDYFRGSAYPPYAGGAMPAHYRDGGYPFRDIGVHGLYLLEAFLGELHDVETHYTATGRDPYLMFDEWHVLAECARGMGRIHLTWNVNPMQNEMWIRGTKGVVHLDLFLQTRSLSAVLPLPKAIQLMYGAISTAAGRLCQVAYNGMRFVAGKFLPAPDIQPAVSQFYASLPPGNAPRVTAEEGRRMVYWLERTASRADADKQVRLATPPCRLSSPILVTGGTGFLGRALVRRLLERGENVRFLVRRVPPEPLASHPCVEWIYGDLGDPDAVQRAVRGVSLVHHVGATMNGCWEEYERGTVRGTRNVVDACLKEGVRRMVYVSSMSVLDYASMDLEARVDESAALEPRPEERGFYSKSKLVAERIVMDAIHNSGLPCVVLRPGQIFGPGSENVPPYGVLSLGSRWAVLGSGNLPLPLVYVEDVVDALVAAAEAPDAMSRVLQLIDPEIVTQREYLAECHNRLPAGTSIMYLPKPLVYMGAIGLEMLGRLLRRRVPLTRYRLRSVKGISKFDCTAAQEVLGWSPRIGVRDGMRLTFSTAKTADEVIPVTCVR